MRVGRIARAGVAAGALALALAGCGGDPGATASDEAATAIGSAAPEPTATAGPTGADGGDGAQGAGATSDDGEILLDPAYAVEEPGRREGAIVPADILIQDSEPLSADVVGAVQDLDGVLDAVPLSVSQVVLENKIYTIAAVDVAQYRRFTTPESADLQAQWDRVAGGEIAASPELRRQLPIDDDDFVTLDKNPDAPRLHVGAWAPQVEGIDLVVNTAVGEALGMPEDNALILSSGQVAPQTLREPLAQIVGDDISVQNLDVVSRLGLDPDAFQTAVLSGSFADAVGVFTYTPIGGGRIAPDPAWVERNISTQVVPILGSVTCNNAMFPQLRAALAEVVKQGLADEINPDEYAGCYYPRFIAGSTTLSNHSFGLALDFNVPGNLRGTVGEMDRDVVAIFKYWGFAWGGDWNYTDPMHFELDQIKRPG